MTDGPSHDRPADADKDQIKPFHAKEVATGQETADVVAAVLKHAAERDEAAKQKMAPKAQPIWMLPLGLMLSVLAGFLLVAPPTWVVVNPIAAQAPEEQVMRLSSQLWLDINKVEAYRITNGSFPRTLAEVGGGGEGIEYSNRGPSYVISAVLGEEVLLFDSSIESARDWAQREIGDLSRRIGG